MKLFAWTEQNQKEWDRKRQLGYKSYMLKTALPWGVFMFIANAGYQWFAFASEKNTLEQFLLTHLLLWSFGAWLLGHLTWTLNERKYRKYRESAAMQQDR